MLTTDNNPVRASADFHTPLCSCFYGEYRSYEDWSVRDGRGQLCYWLKRKQVISTQQILKTTRRTHLLMQRQWWVLGERGFLIYLSCSTVMEQIRMIKLVVIMTPFCFSSVQFTQSCLTLCDSMNRSTPGPPCPPPIPEFTQTHVHRVGEAIQPSHPLSSPSPPAPNPSQHQGLFQWVNSSHEVAKVLEFQL